MLRESLTTAPPKAQKKNGRRPLVMVVIAAACLVAVGLFGFQAPDRKSVSDEALHAHITTLTEHHAYLKNQNEVIGQLIEEGAENQVAVMASIAAVTAAVSFAKAVGPVIQGVGSMYKNIVWGQVVAQETVDPAKIDASFDNSKVFAAELKSRFPESYGIITQLRKDLKIHHFDLSNTIQDVSLLADSTKGGAEKTMRKLNLRNKFIQNGKMAAKPMLDVKIWQYTIRRQVDDLTNSLEKCDAILLILKKLQKDVAKTQDDLERELDLIKNSLESSVKMQRVKMADLEQKLKSTGCVNNSTEMIRAILTLGLGCLFDNDTQKQLKNVKNELVEEEAILNGLLKRMGYFDGLRGVAATLVEQAAGLFETTRRFRATIRDTRDELQQDFTDDDVVENMGDVDFANDFAESLTMSLTNLIEECDRVSADCLQRKHAMDLALVGLGGSEELVELNNSEDWDLHGEFISLQDRCAYYFHNVSSEVRETQNGWFNSTIRTIIHSGPVKDLMLLNAREEYGLVKNKAFDVLDDVRDIHNAVESAEHRITTNAKKMRKYLDKRAEWKYQHKYSTRTTKACIMDKDTVGELVNKLRQDWNDYPQLLTNMADTTLATLISHKMTKQEECVSLSTPAPKPVFNNTRSTRPTRPVTPPTDDTSGSPWTELQSSWSPYTMGGDDDLTADQREELEAWEAKELTRNARHTFCMQQVQKLDGTARKFDKFYQHTKESYAAVEVSRFESSLVDAIAQYETDAAAATTAARPMVGDQQSQAQFYNDQITLKSSAFKADAVAWGDENQALKTIMIS